MIFKNSLFSLIFCFVTTATLLSPSFAHAASSSKYSINLKDWPDDIVSKIEKLAPEVKRKDLEEHELNVILKKLDESFNFNSLKLIKVDNSMDLILVGEISPEVKITFKGLSETTESEALNTMGLSLSNVLDEDNLKAGSEKLILFYRELGYRFAEVKFNIVSESTLVKNVIFTVDKREQTKLRQIKVEGLDEPRLNTSIVRSLIRKYRRADLTQDTLSKISTDLRFYLSWNGYYLADVPSPQIQFAADELTANILYKIVPNQRYKIEVTNTQNFTHDYIEEEILKLNTYYSKDGNIGSELAEELKKFYTNEGYTHASILYYETKINDRIHLYLNVDEGPHTKVVDFTVVGQYSRPEKFYKEKFYELASAKVQDKVYIKEDIEVAAKNLLIYLQNEGFVNAKISRVLTSTDRDDLGRGSIALQIEEGQQVKLTSIEFNGVSEKNKEAVAKSLSLSVGQNLSLAQLENSIANMRNYYLSQGHLEFRLTNSAQDIITYADNNSTAKLKFNVQEGPQVLIQSIDIEGNTRTLDKLILLELDFGTGETLTPAKIEESILRLQRTGYFNSVEIYTLEKETSIANRTVIVKVVERDPGLRVLGIGLTDENGGTLHGYAGVAYRNFWGRGVGVSLRGEANYNFARIRFLENRLTLGSVWPYIFDTRARFRISATRSTTIADTRINKISEANTAIFSIEQDFSSNVTGLLSYAVTTFFDHGIRPSDEIEFGYSSESLVIGSIGPAIELDYRDNLFNPTKGSFTRLAFEYAADGIGNNNVDDFYRATGQTTVYVPFNNSGVVFAQSLRAGYIKVVDDRGEGVPFDKRGFSLGGRTSIRGFESSEFFPTTAQIGASYRLLTASQYQLVKSEIRFPISVKYDLGGAIFYDGGQVSIEGVNFSDYWRDAVGIGIRYNTPVGPLNLEFAKKLDKKTGESDGAFHLSVGVF
jgi:outer membrane protein insertion porin family